LKRSMKRNRQRFKKRVAARKTQEKAESQMIRAPKTMPSLLMNTLIWKVRTTEEV